LENADHNTFHFRDIHPNIYLETTSDRYAGWIGQIYSKERYIGRINRRTESYLTPSVFKVLEKHGVGQVLSHWTWLPPLRRQFAKADNRIFNSGRVLIIRLVTPFDMRYEVAYAKVHPFDKMVEGMLQPKMIDETAQLMHKGIEKGIKVNVLVNNRTRGNAPLIAQAIAEKFLRE
jgi:hypothetical protein